MRRITIDEVRAAYAKTGLRPKTGCYFDGNGCACPIAALYAADGGECGGVSACFVVHKVSDWAGDTFSPDYHDGFVAAIDDDDVDSPEDCDDAASLAAGIQDGLAVRRAIFEAEAA